MPDPTPTGRLFLIWATTMTTAASALVWATLSSTTVTGILTSLGVLLLMIAAAYYTQRLVHRGTG